ncbi:MAG: hypothetical protein AB8B56_09280, partial [Crocinitomicaceae bacterium]
MAKVKSDFKKFPKSIRNDVNFKKAHSYYLLKEHDSTLLYAHNFLSSRRSKDLYSQYCHYFRGTSFQGKKLDKEARKEYETIRPSFPFYHSVRSKLGAIALEDHRFSDALDYYLEVEELPKHTLKYFEMDIMYHDIGLCYLHLENYEESEDYLLKSL